MCRAKSMLNCKTIYEYTVRIQPFENSIRIHIIRQVKIPYIPAKLKWSCIAVWMKTIHILYSYQHWLPFLFKEKWGIVLIVYIQIEMQIVSPMYSVYTIILPLYYSSYSVAFYTEAWYPPTFIAVHEICSTKTIPWFNL